MNRHLTTAALCLMITLGSWTTAHAVDGSEVLRKVDDMWRGSSSAAVMTMKIRTAHWERTLQMKGYSKGKDLSLVRIVLPKQEAGTASLKVDHNMWHYLPKTRRVMKVPSSMMMGSWMGSHFTNDDLVRESRLEEDYSFELEERTGDDGAKIYRITLLPRPEAPVVWGKIVLEVDATTYVPAWEEWYDEDGELVRRADFDAVHKIGSRHVPMVMRVVPTDKPDEFTEITYDKLVFDIDIEDGFFSIQNLKRTAR
jgi:outer membrane lipoprotein-sorting protein